MKNIIKLGLKDKQNIQVKIEKMSFCDRIRLARAILFKRVITFEENNFQGILLMIEDFNSLVEEDLKRCHT
jgi:hypothetical protein